MEGLPAGEEAPGRAVQADPYVPYIRNTFLATPTPCFATGLARSRSEPAMEISSRYEREVHALMFKITPLRTRKFVASLDSNVGYGVWHGSSLASLASLETMSLATSDDTSTGIESLAASDTESTLSFAAGGSPKITSRMLKELQQPAALSVEQCDDATLLEQVPLDEDGNFTSVGSQNHAMGDCRPCAFLVSMKRPCQNGLRCLFCHFSHAPKRRVRLCKRKRVEMRVAVETAVTQAGDEGVAPPPRYLPISWSVESAAKVVSREVVAKLEDSHGGALPWPC